MKFHLPFRRPKAEEPVSPVAKPSEPTSEELEARPEPDSPLKPPAPTDLEKPTWRYVLKRTVREFSRDSCTDRAAALTYYGVLSLFPAFIAIVAIFGLFGQDGSSLQELLRLAHSLGGSELTALVEGPLEELSQQSHSGWLLLVGLAGALWSASGYIGAFGRAVNGIYSMEEGRTFWQLRPMNLLLTAGLLAGVALVSFGLVLTGQVASSVGSWLGMGEAAVTIWQWGKWPLLLLLVTLMVAVLYHYTPNLRQPKFRWLSLGAAVAILSWIIISVGFGFYVSNFSSYDKTYGTLASAIVFLLWLWLTNVALLFGVELDAELERGRELQAGLPAEDHIQLPPRSTRAIEKREEQEAEERGAGRELAADETS